MKKRENGLCAARLDRMYWICEQRNNRDSPTNQSIEVKRDDVYDGKQERALEIIERLKREYPDATCTLDYNEAWKLVGQPEAGGHSAQMRE